MFLALRDVLWVEQNILHNGTRMVGVVKENTVLFASRGVKDVNFTSYPQICPKILVFLFFFK